MRLLLAAISAICVLLCSLGTAPSARADGPLPRDLASAGALRISAGNASEYWDLTVELRENYRVLVRFLITNQGPGKFNGVAVGHVISPQGQATHFSNGRLRSRWKLSEDGLDLKIGGSRLTMHPHQYRLKVSKPDAKIRLSFAPNTLHRLPGDLIEKDYRVDLLALGAAVRGTLQLEGMSEPVPVEGWATLTHTISARSETDMALRRIEILSQKGENPLYVADFLDPAGGHSSWLGYLDPGCDTVIAPSEPSQEEQNRGALVQEPSEASDKPCLRILRSRTAFDLASRGAIHPPSKRGGQTSYWIPPALTLEGQGVGGRVLLKERFLRHDPLGDLPGPIRFLARLSTKPRRVWSPAQFEVTIVPSLNSKPILFQGQGVAAVSFLNPVTRP